MVDGMMVFQRFRGCSAGTDGCQPYSVRTWTLLGSSGKRVYVMERLRFPGSSYDQYRTNVYTVP